MTRATHTTRLGFSLIEMLVVVSIIAVVLSLSFPMIGAMRRDSSVSAGVNTIAQAASAIRLYATESKASESDLLIDNPARSETLGAQGGLYSGSAALFTPAGEIRLTFNDQQARSTDLPGLSTTAGSRIEHLERVGPKMDMLQGSGSPASELNGFRDRDIDYILLPKDTGVAGINRVRGDAGVSAAVDPDNPPWLLPPPFAVWFDQNGYMVVTGWNTAPVPPGPGEPNDYQFVYYDGDYNLDITLDPANTRSDRVSVSNYDPNEFNPNHGDFDSRNWNATAEKYVLPFEKIEAVVGVYVYSLEAFDDAVLNWNDGDTNPATAVPPWADDSEADNILRWEWMKENGQMLMFSKQTGSLMRSRDE